MRTEVYEMKTCFWFEKMILIGLLFKLDLKELLDSHVSIAKYVDAFPDMQNFLTVDQIQW